MGLTVSHTGDNGWYAAGATATLTATDGGSDVTSVEYSLDAGGSWNPYTAPIALDEGTTSLTYRATDGAGNVGTPQTATLRVDGTPPTLSSGRTSSGAVVAAAQDALSGADRVEWSAGDGTWLASPVSLASASTLTVRAVDVAGNTSASQTAATSIGAPALSVVPGSVVVEASGFTPGAAVPLSLQPDAVGLGTVIADADGVVTASGTVPAGATSAAHMLVATLTNTAAPTIAGATTVGSTLTASTGTWNVATAQLVLTYQWLVGGTAVEGATGSTFVVPLDALGRPVSVRVTVSSPLAAADAIADSAPSTPTLDGSAAPVAQQAPVVSGSARVGGTLTVDHGVWNLADSDLTFTVRWTADGVVVPGATGASFTLPASLLGESVGAVVTATVTGGTASADSPSALTTVTAADGSSTVVATALPTVSGSYLVGSTLTASTGTWNVAAADLRFAFQWVGDGVAIPGATGATYVLDATHLGTSVGVVVTATVRDGDHVSAGSATQDVRAASVAVLRLKKKVSSSKHAKATVVVTSPGGVATGTVVVRFGKHTKRVALSNGRAKVRLPHLKPGSYAVRAVYEGAGFVNGSVSSTVRLKVRRP